MNNMINNLRYSIKLSNDSNSKLKKQINAISSLTFKSKLIHLKEKTISPYNTLNKKRKVNEIKNFTLENKTIDISQENRNKLSTYHTSTGTNNSHRFINNYTKKIYLNSTRNIKCEKKKFNKINNINPKENISYEQDFVNFLNLEQNNKDNLSISNYKDKLRRYNHKQLKREININNIIDKKFDKKKQIIHKKYSNKSNEFLINSEEKKDKRNKISIKKRKGKNNTFNEQQKNKFFYDFILQRNADIIKENREQSYNNKQIYHLKMHGVSKKSKIKVFHFHKNKNNSISGNEIIEKINNKNNLKESKALLKIKEKNNEISFNEDELNESDTKINKVLYFETSTNEIFNQFQLNDKNNRDINLNKIQSCKNIKEKKESFNIVIKKIISDKNNNLGESENGEKIKGIINNRIDCNKIKNKNILKIKNDKYLKLKKLSTNTDLSSNKIVPNKKIKKIKNNNNSKGENHLISENNRKPMNKKYVNRKKRAKTMIFNINNINNTNEIIILPILDLNLFYKLFDNNNFRKILFSFCANDILLLNKISLISKHVYKSIKPFIYTQISINIKKYNEDKEQKNKIKINFMKNYSSLLKLSPSILRKKYTDLIFEKNKYDLEIKKDLTRTFPGNNLFKCGNIYYNKLYHILTAFSNYDKSIGYVQGFNFLAANIICFFEDEIDEFAFLDAIIHQFELDKIFDNDLNNQFFETKLKYINHYLIKHLPNLNKFLTENKLNIEFFITNWILTLFSDSMETKYLVIVWDYLIIFGLKFFKYFILNVLILFENDILNSTPNNMTNIKKNMLRNEKFCYHFDELINNTVEIMINDENII